MVSISIHAVENLLLISPIWHLYVKARKRHHLLESTIGPNHLEIQAMNNIWIIAIFSTCLITLSIPLQIALFWGYNLYGHPWKRFLSEVYNSDDDVLVEVISGDALQGAKEKVSESIVKYEGKTQTDQKHEASKGHEIVNEVKSDNVVYESTKIDDTKEMMPVDET